MVICFQVGPIDGFERKKRSKENTGFGLCSWRNDVYQKRKDIIIEEKVVKSSVLQVLILRYLLYCQITMSVKYVKTGTWRSGRRIYIAQGIENHSNSTAR